MTKKPTLPSASRQQRSSLIQKNLRTRVHRNKRRSNKENSDVLVSAVISSYLLSHLHHVLQNAEYLASKEGKLVQSENLAQLRKVLCMDARSMKDAYALGIKEVESEKLHDSNFGTKVA